MCKGAEVGLPLFLKNDSLHYYLSTGKYSVSREDFLQEQFAQVWRIHDARSLLHSRTSSLNIHLKQWHLALLIPNEIAHSAEGLTFCLCFGEADPALSA